MSQSAVSNINAPPSNPAPTAGNIPDLMKIGAIPINTAQEVETKILEPVVKTDSFVRFVFSNAGLLHSHSKIEIGLNNAPEDSCLPIGIGAYALIQRVALKIGNQTLCELDDFAQYYAYRSMFVANENQKEREQMTTGRMISHQFCYADRTSANVGTKDIGGDEADNTANGVGLDNGRDYSMIGTQVDTTAALLANTYADLQQDHAADIPLWQLSLSELCPFLRHNQLPLYLFKEQVALELTFTKGGSGDFQTERAFINANAGGFTDAYPINTDAVRLISDHIFYPQELMVQYANANKVLNFTYADYRLSKYSQTVASAQTQQIRNIGGAGRVVSKIIWGMQDEDDNAQTMLNKFNAHSCTRNYGAGAASANGIATYNIKYNDTFEYPIDVDLSARHFHNVNQAEGLVPFVNRQEYAFEGDVLTGRTYKGVATNLALQGLFNWNANRLGKQERINSRGIELYFKMADLAASTAGYTQRVYLEIMRTATLTNGYLECYFA